MKKIFLALAGFLLLTGCASPTQAAPTPLSIFASPSALPWLQTAYACAPQAGALLRRARIPAEADLRLRLGAPPSPAAFLFVVGEEEIVVAAHPKNRLSLADAAAARDYFSGGADATLWTLDAADETPRFFAAEILLERPLDSSARLAASPQEMAQALSADENAVGVLGLHSAENLRVVFSAGKLPVVAETTSQPEGALLFLLACLQQSLPAALPPEPGS